MNNYTLYTLSLFYLLLYIYRHKVTLPTNVDMTGSKPLQSE